MTEPLSDRRELEIDGLCIASEQAGEGSLLALSAQLEAARPWAQRRPEARELQQ